MLKTLGTFAVKTVVTMAFCLMSTVSYSQNYGDLYLAVDSKAPLADLSLGYRIGFSNPYFYSHGLTASGRVYAFEQIGFIEVEGVYYSPQANRMNQEIRDLLDDQGLDALIFQPRYSVGIRAGVKALSGLLNFFSYSVVPFDLSLSASVGRASYLEEDARGYWGSQLDFIAFFTPRFGVGSGFLMQFEKSPSLGWLSSIDVLFKTSFRFF